MRKLYAKQATITTAQALSHLEELTSKEAQELPEGLSLIQLRNLLESIEAAQYTLNRLHRATEQNIGWLEESEGETPNTIELPLLPDYPPAA
ncbi:MAG: hypothetical protein SFU83_09980 [Meiothermus sp.]|nr:hypothetical protein [Meiothermus sp.]